MKLVLKDFQRDAVNELYIHVADAQARAASNRLQAITLSAPTGSGKTVMMTRLIEMVLEGDEHHPSSPDSVFLWLTDQPELNVQTRDKMRATSESLHSANTIDIDANFDSEQFQRGKVYFLNTQKLGSSTNWVKRGDKRTFTLWDTIRNTASNRPSKFFVIIDEAHRGARLDPAKAKEANSIMQKFIIGSDEIPPIPIVVGVSATLDRFTELLAFAAKAKKPRTHHPVDVPPADVILSGLLKTKVVLDPSKQRGAEFPLLRQAVKDWRDMEQRWSRYCEAQQEAETVKPILLVQVEDGTKTKVSNTDLRALVSAIREEASDLSTSALAHAFQEGKTIPLEDGTGIRYLAPSAIDGDGDVKIVLFKTSLNTGWDCPRAEVMMSFRKAKDATLIAQLVGRMVRAPLARHVDQDDVLNSVSLLLPHFDSEELGKVVEKLTSGNDVPPTTVELSKNRFILNRAPRMERCFDALTGAPSYEIPRRRQISDVQRLGQFGDLLSHSGLRAKAGSEARDHLVEVLATQYEKCKGSSRYTNIVKEDGAIPVSSFVFDYQTNDIVQGETRNIPISREMVSELYEWARKRLGLDLGLRYWMKRADGDSSDNHILTKLELYALASDSAVMQQLEQSAANLIGDWIYKHKAAIKKLPESDKALFEEVRRQAKKPALSELDFTNRLTIDWSAPDQAPRWKNHLYQDGNGEFPEKLNKWESPTLEEEMERDDFVAWLRNPPSKPWALCVPYELNGEWKGCYPDFLVFREVEGNVVVDIVDPHLTSLEDAPAKASALARFAEDHGDWFGRVDLVLVENAGEDDERIKRLSLLNDKIRARVRAVTTNQHLRDLFDLSS